VRFSDAFGMEARLVRGVYPQAHMRGKEGLMLCLYDRRSKRAEVQEAQEWSEALEAPEAPPSAPASPVGATWVAEDFGGRERSPFTLVLGSGGRMEGKAGCNSYSARYRLEGASLEVIPPFMGTKMACAPELMTQESRFLSLLGTANRATMESADRLVLAVPGGQPLRFRRGEEAAAPTQPELSLRCGGESLRVAFAEEQAVVELARGGRATLPRLEGSTWARTYTDGRLTLVQTRGGRERGVTFARGRAAPVSCEQD
jgi:heat shock protein HslJ